MDALNDKKFYSTGGLAFSVITVVYVVLSLVYGIIAELMGGISQSQALLYFAYLVSPISILITLSFFKFNKKLTFFQLTGINKCKPKYFLIGVLLIFGLLFSLGWVNEVTVNFFELFGYEQRPVESYFPDVSGFKIIPALIFLAVVPAIFEDAFFRGILLNGAEEDAGSIASIFIVGLCFSLFHASPEQTVYQFICGCAFALLTIRAKSTLPAIFIHFLNNALVVIIQAVFPNGEIPMSPIVEYIILGVSAACLVGALLWLILDKTPLKKAQKNGVKAFFAFASVGLGLLILLWISAFFG